MATIADWEKVKTYYNELRKYTGFADVISAMLDLVDRISNDPRMGDATPGVSHLSLIFRLPDIGRYVAAEWWFEKGMHKEDVQYSISFVGDMLEVSETMRVPLSQCGDTIANYLLKLRNMSRA